MKKILVLCSLLCGLGNSAFGAYYSGFPMCKTHGAQPNSIIAFDCGADSDAEFPSLDELKHMRVEDVILCNWRSGGLEKVFDLLQDRCDLKMIRISDCNISNRELDALLRLLDANQYIKGVFFLFSCKMTETVFNKLVNALEHNDNLIGYGFGRVSGVNEELVKEANRRQQEKTCPYPCRKSAPAPAAANSTDNWSSSWCVIS